MPIKYDPDITIKKSAKNAVATSAAAAIIIKYVLENHLGVETTKEQLLIVSSAIGVVTGIIRGIVNFWKNRKKII